MDRRIEVCESEGRVCVCEVVEVSSIFRLIRRDVSLSRIIPTLDLRWMG